MAGTLELTSPATGQSLGSVPQSTVKDVVAAVERARAPQPLWALVPARARGEYLRRAAQAILDELDALA